MLYFTPNLKAQNDTIYVVNDTLCPSNLLDSASLFVSMASGNQNYFFNWIFNASGLGQPNSDSTQAAPAQSTTYTLKATHKQTGFNTILHASVHVEPDIRAGIGDTIRVCSNDDSVSLFTGISQNSTHAGSWWFNGSLTDSVFTVGQDQIGPYLYIVNPPVCEPDTAIVQVVLNSPPTTTPGQGQVFVNPGATGQFTTSSSNGTPPYSFQWSPSTFLLNSQQPSPYFSNAQYSLPYTLLTTDATGCTDLDTVVLTVVGSPLTISTPQTAFHDCFGFVETLDIGVTGGSGVYTYDWTPGHLLNDSTIEDPTIVATDTVNLELIVTDDMGNSDTIYILISPYPDVAIGFSPITSACDGWAGFQIQASVFPPGGSFTGMGIDSAGYFNPSLPSEGNHQLTYTFVDIHGCHHDTTQTITILPPPNIDVTNIPSVCNTDPTFNLDNYVYPTGGTYSGAGMSGTYFDPSQFGSSTSISVQYSYTDSNFCYNDISISVDVMAIGTINAGIPASQLCLNASPYQLGGGSPSGGVYSGPSISNGFFYPAIADTGFHMITYTVGDTNGCYSQAYDYITVVDTTSILVDSLYEYCYDEPAFLLNMASPNGGSYTGTAISSNTFFPALAGAASHEITYQVFSSIGCSSQKKFSINVHALPQISGNIITDTVCEDASTITLSGFNPTGGVFSGATVNGTSFFPSAAGPGTHYITYEFTDTNGCAANVIDQVEVLSGPNVSIPSITPPCLSAGPVPLNTGIPAGGSFGGMYVNNNIFYPDSAGIGLHQVSYTYTDNQGCSNTALQTIFVQSSPNLSSTQPSALCEDASPIILNFASPIGGVYNGPGLIAGTFDPALAGPGLHTVTYSLGNANGCSDTISIAIQVNDVPMVTLGAYPDFCVNYGNVQLLGGQPLGGTFSGPGIVGHEFNTISTGVGSHPLYYTYADSNGCSATASSSITVMDLTQTTIASQPSLCIHDQPVVLNGGTPPGGFFFGIGVVNAVFYPDISGPGAHQIGYSISDTLGCVDTSYTTITVFPRPYLFLDTSIQFCVNDQPSMLDPVFPSGGSYSGVGVSANNFFSPSLAGTGIHSIYYDYTDFMGCTRDTVFPITVLDLPNVNLDTIGSFCVTDPPVALTQGSPAGGYYTGPGVNNDSLFPAFAGTGFHEIRYIFTDNNGCTGRAKNNASVFPVPPKPVISFINGIMVCDWGFYDYQWYYNGAPINGATDQLFTPIDTGLYFIEITNSFGCSSISDDFDFPGMVGIEEESLSFNIYPNPSSGLLTIEVEEKSLNDLSLYDIHGRRIEVKGEVISNGIQLDLGHLANGVYVIQVGDFPAQRLILQK